MVDIESMSDEEKIMETKLENIVSLAKVIPRIHKVYSLGYYITLVEEDGSVPISASLLGENLKINVYSSERFDDAVKLAEKYEGITKEKVTVKKEYRE